MLDAAAPSYDAVIQPILNRRCVVCHACNDAPCQLKTTSWEGIARGASKMPVYDATRLVPAAPSRLGVDADSASDWRGRGFFSVLNERAPTLEANQDAGLMHRLLMLKRAHPLPAREVVGGGLDFSIARPATCPADGEIGRYERDMPLAGMPFGLPGLSPDEHGALTRWIGAGAPGSRAQPLPPVTAQRVLQWEAFLNGDSAKERLFSRYAYEHLFLAHLYFDDDQSRRYFKLVRSATPPGKAVVPIRSRRPVDDPGVARVYYRLVPEQETVVAKTHMPYELGASRMARWRSLFLEAPYAVDRLPGYDESTAANPFATFAAIPVGARYRFMLDEAEYTIMGFIKGPVCRGQMALDVIRDRFWVSFLAPSAEYDAALSDLLARDANFLRLPTGSSDTGVLIPWLHYARLENDYLQARTAFYAKALGNSTNLDLRLIWDGDGQNTNAALTVFRHYDSASVVKGFVGGPPPETAWVIGYPLLERLHYLLVANFDVYGNIGHQLNSRLYMDFLRMEGEFNFISLLPQSRRNEVRDRWYRGDSLATREQVYGGSATTLQVESGVGFRTADVRHELMAQIGQRMSPVLDRRFDLDRSDARWASDLQRLASLRGTALQWLPESVVLVVGTDDQRPATFNLLRNTAHGSVSHLLGERRELRPEEDTLTVVPGLIGSYPNAFFRVPARELPELTRAIGSLGSEADYTRLVERWGVRRADPAFWAVSDAVHERYTRDQPLQAGILDYNRLENR
ncbi:fatty acid cis/trans isomerase [Variovorax sp. KK3]|uniref:fatty acid cis/trans isomerase n=1 Tax=Variovorax sp. KK3 TaxID=1855728 RepID=UPI002119660A|nr:fatty acid cis/trans isomerase [Variovorax sp. KK3]